MGFLWHYIGNRVAKHCAMETQDNNKSSQQEQKDKRTDFFEKREMNLDTDDAANAGDESFTPIYLNEDSVLQTPEEKEHDERIDPQENDKMEAMEFDARETTFDKLNNEERNGVGE